MIINQEKNEVSFDFGGEERTFRMRADSMLRIEKDLGIPLVPLIDKFEGGEVGYTEVSMVLYWGLKGNDDNRFLKEDVSKIIMDEGFMGMCTNASTLLALAFYGGKNLAKKAAKTAKKNKRGSKTSKPRGKNT